MKASGVMLMPPTDPALSLEAILQVQLPPACLSLSHPLAASTRSIRHLSAKRTACPLLRAYCPPKNRVASDWRRRRRVGLLLSMDKQLARPTHWV